MQIEVVLAERAMHSRRPVRRQLESQRRGAALERGVALLPNQLCQLVHHVLLAFGIEGIERELDGCAQVLMTAQERTLLLQLRIDGVVRVRDIGEVIPLSRPDSRVARAVTRYQKS